jgi:hypothetical protein
MLIALGAASSLWDTLQSLAASNASSTQSAGTSQTASSPFSLTGPAAPSTPSAPSGTTGSNQISPQTLSALLDAQSQTGSTGTASLSRSQALQDLFSDIDANGDSEISKQEFENALGAGGTNVAAADQVFNQIDSNGDGEINLNELKSALQGAGGHHGGHHHHAASSTGSADGSDSSSTNPDNTDPLLQALAASAGTTSGNSSSGSIAPSLTFDPSQLTPISLSASTYNTIEKLIRSGQALATAPLSVSA